MDEMRVQEPVPYVVYEAERARAERLLKDERERHDKNLREEREARRKNRLLDFVVIIVLVLVAVGSNIAWIVYESQFEKYTEKTVETTTEGGGDAYGTIIDGTENEVFYGESKSDSEDGANP